MADVTIRRVSFAAGELSPFLQFRDDLARNQIGAAKIDGFYVMLEGGLQRPPGTRFVIPLKSETQWGELMPFRYSGSDAYMLLFNGGVMRVLKDGGVLETSPGVIYELAQPYLSADLQAGKLRWQQDPDNNRVFICCEGYQPRYLQRAGHTSWTLNLYIPAGGPVDGQNLDTNKTIIASGISGAITLTANTAMFTTGDVNGTYRLDEANLALTKNWEADEVLLSDETQIAPGAFANIGDLTGGGGLAEAFDGTTVRAQANCATKPAANTGYVGKDFGGTPQTISRVLAVGSNDQGFIDWGAPTTLTLYGKNGAAPANATDGKELGSLAFTNVNDESGGRYIYSTDNQTAWRYVWVTIAQASAPTIISVAEVKFFKWTNATPKHQRRFNGRVYLALNDGNTKQQPPTHDEGDARYGDIVWRFLHNGYGFVYITAFTSSTVLQGSVLSRLPDSVTTTPTYRWWPPAWSNGKGWPDNCFLHQGQLFFTRRNEFWATRPSDLFSLEETPPVNAQPDPDSALAVRLTSRGQGLPWIVWGYSSSVLLLGLRDYELTIRAPQLFDPLTIDKLRPVPATAEGSAPHRPAQVDDGAIMIGRSRKRLHFLKFGNLQAAVEIEEMPITHRRLFGRAGATDLAWQRDPNRILWVRDTDGILAGITFMPEQQVLAPFRRPVGTAGFLEKIAAIPTSDEGATDVYTIVRRGTRRFVEMMRPYFSPLNVAAPTGEGAWFVDSGLAYVGTPATVMSGLSHLEGSTVRVFADGAMQTDKVVVGGQITLDAAASNVVVGLPINAVFRSLPFEVDDKSKGKRKSPHHVLVDLVESAGGRVRVICYDENGAEDPQQWDELLPTGDVNYGQPIPLFTGTVRVPVSSSSAVRVAVEIEANHAMPMTIAGVSPDMTVEGG